MTPRSEPRTRTLLHWSAAGVIVLAYALYYGQTVMRHTAVPYFDQTNYMYRIYYIHDVWKNAKRLGDYSDIFGGAFAGRPPLMMIPPAMLWGDHAHPQAVALLWLVIRMGVLLLAMVALSRVFNTARFVPAALMAILGSAFFLDVQPQLYLMDQTFAVFGLLVFALVLRDLARPSVSTATAVALGTLMLVLVKPAGLSFVFPMFCVVAVRGVIRLVAILRERQDPWGSLAWATVYGVMMAALVLLWKSPYGRAVAAQYQLGSRGYWTGQVTLTDAVMFATLVIPVWLLFLLGLYLIRYRRIGISTWVVACAAVTAVWWYVFNTFVAYVADPRVLIGVLCVSVACALVILCQDARLAAVATTVAGVLFVSNLATAAGARNALQALVGPVAKAQRPVPEVGLLPLAERVRAEIVKVHQPTEHVVVMAAVNDEFVEFAALNLAMRYAGGDVWSPIQFQPLPWGSSEFDLTRLLQSRWFLTKRTRSAIALHGDAWVSLYAMDALITNPASPLQRYFAKRLEAPIRQPEFGDRALFAAEIPERTIDDTVTLWYMPQTPLLSDQAKALRWVEPRFRNTPGHAALLSRLERVEAVAGRGSAVPMIDAVAAQKIVAAAEPPLRRIAFDDRFRLLGMVQRRSGEAVELELAWESLQDQALDCIVFVHLLDAKKTIVGQLDYAQDQFQGRVKKGDVWRDVVRIPREKLDRVETIGLGVIRLPAQIFRADHGPTDWDGHRLTIAVK